MITDDFNRADSSTLGANWTTGTGFASNGILSNQCVGTSNGTFCVDHYSGASWAAAQSSQITVVNLDGVTGVTCRGSGDNFYNFYKQAPSVGGTCVVFEWNSGTPTILLSFFAATIIATDTMKISINGSDLIDCMINGASQGTVTDSTHASGSPGILQIGTTQLCDDWIGEGNVAAAGNPWYYYAQN